MVWLFVSLLSFSSFSLSRSYLDFPKTSGQVGSQKIKNLYLAATPEDRSLGLMHVTSLEKDSGLLFVFEQEQPLSFWMKNTFIPLSIGFFDAKGCLLETFEMTPVKSVLDKQIPRYESSRPAHYALEMNKGWFTRHRVKVGSSLIVRPTKGQPSLTMIKSGKCSVGKVSKGT